MQRSFFRRSSPIRICLVVLLLVLCCAPISSRAQRLEDAVYKNPLTLQTLGRLAIESCPDPAMTRGQPPNDSRWYLFCSSGPFGDAERDGNGQLIAHTLPIFSSFDLINWTFAGDALLARPSWAQFSATISAPDVQYFNNKYYLYYTVSDTTVPNGGSAIGVATSSAPTGPWTDSGAPVVDAQVAPQMAGTLRWLSDASVLLDSDGQKYIYYGGASGGIVVRKLAADGLKSDPTTQTQITIGQRYEGTSIVKRNGFYYLFASAPDCCRGPLTGANIFAGRATSPLGPFVDRDGVSLLSGRVGGTPVISANGNRWIGLGHSVVITDLQGQDWLVYHAVDRLNPYFSREPGNTKRPVLLDQLNWIDGWPTVRSGRWASDSPMSAPAAQLGAALVAAQPPPRIEPLNTPLAALSDEFNGPALNYQWSWVRPPAASSYGIISGTLRMDTQPGSLLQDVNTAAVLTEPAPSASYVIETRMRLNLPPEGCCYNPIQAGLIIYGDDDHYLTLTHAAQFETRQITFAKELVPTLPGDPHYGSMVVGTPSEWTYLRIARWVFANEDIYTAYTSRDGSNWTRGGTWTHNLGFNAKIGLVAMGGSGYAAFFDYVHVYQFDSTTNLPSASQTSPPFAPIEDTSSMELKP